MKVGLVRLSGALAPLGRLAVSLCYTGLINSTPYYMVIYTCNTIVISHVSYRDQLT
jgi:hypothetical protein